MTQREKKGKAEDSLSRTASQVIELLTGRKIIAFKDWMYFRKTYTPHILDDNGEILLHLSDNYAEGPMVEPAWNELIGFGPLCKYIREEHIGGKCLLPVMHSQMFRLGSMTEENDGEIIANEDWAIKENALTEFAGFICIEDS